MAVGARRGLSGRGPLTPLQKKVMEAFLDADAAVSCGDLARSCGAVYDTVYRYIRQLSSMKLVEAAEVGREMVKGRKPLCYTLTEEGRIRVAALLRGA